MTRDDIIRMARHVGICDGPFEFQMVSPEDLRRFAKLVSAAEREAILSKATKARDVDANCAIVLVADIRARSAP